MISSVVSDTFGVSSMRIIQHILDNPDETDFDVSSMLHGRMKHKAETIVKSIHGNLTKLQADKMRVCLNHVDAIEQHIADIETIRFRISSTLPATNRIDFILAEHQRHFYGNCYPW